MGECFIPYLRALERVLSGEPVHELERLRQEGCQRYLTRVLPILPEPGVQYSPASIVVQYFANAENRIAAGEDPLKVYGGIRGVEPEELRRIGRSILEEVISRYCSK